MGVGEGAALDSGQRVAQRHRDLAGFAVGDGEFTLGVFDMGDRRDDGRGAAGEHLGDLARRSLLLPFVDVDLAFLDGEAGSGPGTGQPISSIRVLPVEVEITSNSTCLSTPNFSPITNASEVARVAIAAIILLQIFTT